MGIEFLGVNQGIRIGNVLVGEKLCLLVRTEKYNVRRIADPIPVGVLSAVVAPVVAHPARPDFLHKISSKLVRENQAIAVETLNVEGMLKNGNLSLSISDSSWSEFFQMLDYKCKESENHSSR